MWVNLRLSTLSLSELLSGFDQRKPEFSGTKQDFQAANNFDPFFSLKAGKYHELTSLAQSQLQNTHNYVYNI